MDSYVYATTPVEAPEHVAVRVGRWLEPEIVDPGVIVAAGVNAMDRYYRVPRPFFERLFAATREYQAVHAALGAMPEYKIVPTMAFVLTDPKANNG